MQTHGLFHQKLMGNYKSSIKTYLFYSDILEFVFLNQRLFLFFHIVTAIIIAKSIKITAAISDNFVIVNLTLEMRRHCFYSFIYSEDSLLLLIYVIILCYTISYLVFYHIIESQTSCSNANLIFLSLRLMNDNDKVKL